MMTLTIMLINVAFEVSAVLYEVLALFGLLMLLVATVFLAIGISRRKK